MPRWLSFPFFYLSYLNPIHTGFKEEYCAGIFKSSLSCKHVFRGAWFFSHNFLLLCMRHTVIPFNFITKHSHLTSGQRGADLLLRSFVPGRSFS